MPDATSTLRIAHLCRLLVVAFALCTGCSTDPEPIADLQPTPLVWKVGDTSITTTTIPPALVVEIDTHVVIDVEITPAWTKTHWLNTHSGVSYAEWIESGLLRRSVGDVDFGIIGKLPTRRGEVFKIDSTPITKSDGSKNGWHLTRWQTLNADTVFATADTNFRCAYFTIARSREGSTETPGVYMETRFLYSPDFGMMQFQELKRDSGEAQVHIVNTSRVTKIKRLR